ncbi:8704_t:CDS:2 [Diversispora eburnea]|uniref:8704_t:CDS:1 n=1 Tax=Diversispora eburnea TaxID=1213867 RepID=A0A9N9B455_9GLOM|nr:8704_t:CDS:2 [Diversispora eburnea]
MDRREFALRILIFLTFSGLILWSSMEGILIVFGVKKSDPLVSLSVKNFKETGIGIPIWSSFICSQNLTGITVETLERGGNTGNGTETKDKPTRLPDSYISKTDTNALTTGDWTLTSGSWPCFIFNNSNKDYKFIPGIVDQLIIVAFVNGEQSQADNGIIFGVYDDLRPLNEVEPFTAGIPSINTYTFTLTEKEDVNNKDELYFTVNKQNYHSTTFKGSSIAARFLYSPDTYMVVRYIEKPQYTFYAVISATGGNLTYAIALWIILFGRGKYKSWGFIHRYILRNSPDAHKKDNSNRLLNIPFYSNKEKIALDNDKNKGNNLESQVNQTPNPPLSFITSSQQQQNDYYSVSKYTDSALFFTTNETPTIFSKNATSERFGNIGDENDNIDDEIRCSRNGIGRLSEITDREITKKLNKIVDEKLWFLEQTISRHYLSGFRLRRYDSDLKKLKHKSSYYFDNNVKNNLKNNLENNLEEENNQLDRDEIKSSPRRSSSSSHSYPVQIDLEKENPKNLEDHL